jgi:hypothetical protein
MPLKKEIDQALHTEEVVNLINGEKKYFDWVGISSFYSALHFVRGKMFPFDELINDKTVNYTSFDAYCLIRGNEFKSKHKILLELVNKRLPSISAKYKWLFDLSVTARYSDYQILELIGNAAVKKLQDIKNACI